MTGAAALNLFAEPAPTPPKDKSPEPTSISQVVRVQIKTSRPVVTLEKSFGVYADVENVSTIPLTLVAGFTTLAIQPELTSTGCVWGFDGFFPTEPFDSNSTIRIQPGEHYTVLWNLDRKRAKCPDDASPKGFWDRLTWFFRKLSDPLNFSPGNYIFVVEGKAFTSPGDIGQAANGRPVAKGPFHTFSESTSLEVVISQVQAIIAAVFGGVLAYLVTLARGGADLARFQQSGDTKARVGASFVIVKNLLSAMLLSATVTILLSRVSETNFPVKVTIADFWGSLTIGFVAYFAGTRFIDWLAGKPVETPSSPQNPTSTNEHV